MLEIMNIHKHIAYAFYAGVILNIGGYFLKDGDIKRVLFVGITLLIMGMATSLVSKALISNQKKELITVGLMVISLPIIMNEPSTANITWPIGILLFLFLTLSKNRNIILIALVGSIGTQVWLWHNYPEVTVTITAGDYIFRIFIYSVVIGSVHFINGIYINKINMVKAQLELQRVISDISKSFIYPKLDESKLSEIINNSLESLGLFFKVDRAYIFLFSKDLKCAKHSFEWCRRDIEEMQEKVNDIETESIPWWMSKVLNNEVLNIENIDELPLKAEEEKLILESQNIRSLLSVPMNKGVEVIGFIGFDSVKNHRRWSKEEVDALKVVSQLISDAIVIARAEKEIRGHLDRLETYANYDNLTGLPNRRYLFEKLDEIILESEKFKENFALLFIDLDGFKAINDNYGHEVGDKVLKEIGNRVRSSVRRSDLVSRIGGDEIVVVMRNSQEDINSRVKKLQSEIKKSINIDDIYCEVDSSVGVAIYPDSGKDKNTLIERADSCMYDIKKNGKSGFKIADNFKSKNASW